MRLVSLHVLWVTGAVLIVLGFRLASNYIYASTAVRKILLFDALIMIYGKWIFIFWFWSFANQKYQKVRKSRKWKECLVLSITLDTWPWMPDKSGAVSGAKACRAPKLLKKPARKAGKSKASKLSTVRLFSQKFTNFSINSKTKACLLQGHLPTVVMTTSKLIFTGRHSGHIII